MSKYSDDKTDELFDELKGKISATYNKARIELDQKAQSYFADYQRRWQEEYVKYQKGVYTKEQWIAWQNTQIARGQRWEKLRDDMAARLVDADKVAMAYINDSTPTIYALNYNYEAYEISKGTGVAFNIYDEQTVKRLIKDDPKLFPAPKVDIPKAERWDQQKLQQALVSGILQGQSIDEIAKVFNTVIKAEESHARTMARTAYTGAQNAGRQKSYESAAEMGIEIEKEWMATLDPRTRDSHQRLDGERVPHDGKFSNGLEYPADSNGEPAEVYNCRCTMRAILPKYNANRHMERNFKDKDNNNLWNDDGTPKTAQGVTYNGQYGSMSYDEWLQVMDSPTAEMIDDSNMTDAERLQYIQDLVEKEQEGLEYAQYTNYGGMTIEQAEVLNATMAEMQAKYPTNKLARIVVDDKRHANAASNYQSLVINSNKIDNNGMSKFKEKQNFEALKLVRLTEKYPNESDRSEVVNELIERYTSYISFDRYGVADSYEGQEARVTYIHEYAHIIYDQYIGGIANKTDDPDRLAMQEKWANLYETSIESGFTKKMSLYSEKNPQDFFAECFAAREMGEKLPKNINDAIEEVLNYGAM